MKKSLLIVALVATAFCANAQVNIQEQYDFNREHLKGCGEVLSVKIVLFLNVDLRIGAKCCSDEGYDK